ncbi:hypothetical protein QQF64_025922 [Cirrhinus molitorella]|uniref:Uncharacterized protein n=1 Tax=Cirrhinus molitorella TaxID=172907 RepID=A0ABR3NQP7_9TELE
MFQLCQATSPAKKASGQRSEKQGSSKQVMLQEIVRPDSRERLEELELNPVEQDPQLEQSVSQIRNSVSLQEVELVELRELALSHAISSERSGPALHNTRPQQPTTHRCVSTTAATPHSDNTGQRPPKGPQRSSEPQEDERRTPSSPPKKARATTTPQPVRYFHPGPKPGSGFPPQPRPGHPPQPPQPALYYQPTPQQLRPQQQDSLSWDQHQHNHRRPRAAPARNNSIRTEQQLGPPPQPHRPEWQEQRSYATALQEPNHTNLVEIKDQLRLICTWLEQ